MSTVISFRVDPDNPREAQAMSILAEHQEQGFSIRQVMIEALLNLAEEPDDAISPLVNELQEVLGKAQFLMDQLQSMPQRFSPSSKDVGREATELTEGFLLSVKNAAKPGVQAE